MAPSEGAGTRPSKARESTPSRRGLQQAIHQAVLNSAGLDFYIRERLDWRLLSRYHNRASQREGGTYKRKFALVPTVDYAYLV